MPRRVIEDFADALEHTLIRNDHKACWTVEKHVDMVEKLKEEVIELLQELDDVDRSHLRIRSEALDVAAVAMMLWDRSRVHPSSNRGLV